MKLSALLLLSTFSGSNAFFRSHDIITHDDGSVHLFEKTQHRRLTTKNLKANSDPTNTKFTVHGSEYITMNLHVDGYTTVGGLEFENADDSFGNNFLTALAGNGITVDSGKLTAIALGTSSSTALAGDTTTISSDQASAITANTAKTGITSGQASAITANTAKTGITAGQASAITANTAKTGITSGQASAITANTAKVSMTFGTTGGVALEGDTTTISTAQSNAITANTAKTGITSGQASAITANTAKTGITSGQASAITANTAKTGITSGQASAITANTAKVSMTFGTTGGVALEGDTTTISTAQSNAITANTAKVVLTAAANSGLTISGSAISANVATGVIKDALDAVEAADTTTAVQKEYRLERMVLVLCNTLGIKYEHLVRAVDEGTFDPYERFSAIQVNDDDLYSTDSNSKLVDVTAVSTALCSTFTNYASACASGYSNRHALAMCASGTCAASDFTASGLCCVPN